jgi:hypothetical protein
MALYDFLYVDLPKVVSMYSQLTGGVVETTEISTQSSRTSDNKRNYDFKIFRHDAGGTEDLRQSEKELIKPHHALLLDLERELTNQGYLFDLGLDGTLTSLSDTTSRERIARYLCIKATGRVVIEDYERIKNIAVAFPEIVKLINKSNQSSLLSSPAYLELQEQIKEASQQAKNERNPQQKSFKEVQLREVKQRVKQLEEASPGVPGVDQWILDGMKTWIDTFLPGIINLRLYPDSSSPAEQIFGHLKKEFFEESDLNSFHFTYGSKPSEKLTMIGIITSVPAQEDDEFDPMSEFIRDDLQDAESVEKGFRATFRGFDGFEQMIRTLRYPRILVQPLVLYRSVLPQQE